MSFSDYKKMAFVAVVLVLAVSYNNCSKVDFSNGQPNQNNSSNSPNGIVSNPPGQTGDGIPSTPPISFGNTNCKIGYPFSSSNPATSTVFNESDVLAAFTPGGSVSSSGATIAIWYSDEHAMTLGISQVNVKTLAGTTTTNYPLSSLLSDPGFQLNPQVGATVQQGGVDTSVCSRSTSAQDACSRPMFPALFVTDTTANATSMSGDWQSGGTPIPPTAVYGTWKGAIRTVDMTQNPPKVSISVGSDPVPNDWNLGMNVLIPTTIPSGTDSGYGAMVSWDVKSLGLEPGHTYRIQFMVHDGDQNQSGGDVGENCINLQAQ